MSPTWEDALEGCLGYLATEKSHAINTQLINRIVLESFVAWMEKNRPGHAPGGLTGDDIRGFLRAQRTERRLAPASMKMVVVALRHIFSHLKRENLIEHDLLPALDLPRLDQYLPDTLSEAEVEQFLNVELPGTPLGLRDRALLEVLYASGLRAGEIAGLRLENFLREEKLLRVIGKGNRERLVPVGEKAIAAIDQWLARGRPLLVKPKTGGELFLAGHGRRLTTARIWQIVQEMAVLLEYSPQHIWHGKYDSSKRNVGQVAPLLPLPLNCGAVSATRTWSSFAGVRNDLLLGIRGKDLSAQGQRSTPGHSVEAGPDCGSGLGSVP